MGESEKEEVLREREWCFSGGWSMQTAGLTEALLIKALTDTELSPTLFW